MKKALSIILVISMVITMIPVAFASEGEGAIVYSPRYEFSSTALGWEEPKWNEFAGVVDIQNEYSTGKWSFSGAPATSRYYIEPNGVQAYITSLSPVMWENAFLFKITVDADGKYIPTYENKKWPYGGAVDIYLADVDYVSESGINIATTAGLAAVKTAFEQGNENVKFAMGVDTNAPEHGSMRPETGDEIIDLKAGEYYLILTMGVGADPSNHGSSRTYNHFKSFTLTRQPYVEIAESADAVEIGKTIKLNGKAFNGDNTDAGAVTYSVVPEGVVSVAADGTVTTVAVGNATITAKATIGGVEYTDSVDITVKPIDKTHKFIFNSTMLSEETIAAAKTAGSYITSENRLETNRNIPSNTGVFTESGVEFMDEYSDFAANKESDDWAYSYLGGARIYLGDERMVLYVGKTRYGNVGYLTHSSSIQNLNTRYVFKINVKDRGTYDISADVNEWIQGTEADVYIVKTAEVDASPLLGTDTKAVPQRKRITLEYLKTLPIDGRISNVGDENGASKNDFICTKTLDAGEYYVILHLNSDSEVTANGSHLLYISSLNLVESTGEITAPETPITVKDTVSFATNICGEFEKMQITRGESVAISAPETDGNGNVFKCWVKGTEENGVWVSSKAEDTYKVMTNTYLTAVYEAPAENEGKVVEFYNENGEYYATVPAVDGKAVFPTEEPKLAGYEFEGWYVSEEDKLEEGEELSANVTYAVAKFAGTTVLNSSTNDVVKVNGTAQTKYNFGDLVTANDTKAMYWLRNGEIVKFGTSYDYYIWDGANIMSSYDTTTAIRPTVVIDTTSVDGAYMIEYDKGNRNISEVGILFGSSAKMTVDSCHYKATSQWSREHGQFMAKPYGDKAKEMYARGYLIYKDGGSYKVIYTESIEVK